MGVLWKLFLDDENFGRLAQREIRHSEIIVELKQKFDGPFLAVSPDALEQELGAVRREVSNLRQELYEELSRSHVERDNAWNARLKSLEERVQKIGLGVVPTPTADSAKIQDAVKQLQADQQNILRRLGQLENAPRNPQPAFPVAKDEAETLNGRWTALARDMETMKGQLAASFQTVESFRVALDAAMRENTSLRQQMALQDQRLAALEKQNETQARVLDEMKRQIAGLVQLGATAKPASEPKPAPPLPKPQPPTTPEKPWISYFFLPKAARNQVYFHGDAEEAKSKLAESIQNMDELVTGVSQSGIPEPEKSSFEKNLRWCMEALEKLYRKFDFEGCDPEDISEELTEKFFKIVSEYLLDNVMVPIYRGGKGSTGYGKLLQSVNRYLSNHGIYTLDIVPGELAAGDMLASIEDIAYKSAQTKAEDGKIAEVELLPYFMPYKDDNGSTDTVRKRGRIVCLKFGE